MTETTVYQSVCCIHCGVMFALTHEHVKHLAKTSDEFHCPNGHEMHFKSSEETEKEKRAVSLEQRQELILAIHRAEQAEAKAAEANGGSERAELPAVDDNAAATEKRQDLLDKARAVIAARAEQSTAQSDPESIVWYDGWRLVCKKCGKRYKYRAGIAKHLRLAHGIAQDVAERVVNAAVDLIRRPIPDP